MKVRIVVVGHSSPFEATRTIVEHSGRLAGFRDNEKWRVAVVSVGIIADVGVAEDRSCHASGAYRNAS